MLQNNEYTAWSTFQILNGGEGSIQIIHTLPSWSDLITFYSRSFLLNGTRVSSNDLRVDTHAPVYSINSFEDGSLAAVLINSDNDVDDLMLQIYGLGQNVHWYQIDFLLYVSQSSLISNIKTKSYNDTAMGLLYSNATSDGVPQHVLFQIFNESAVTQWDEPIVIDVSDSNYNYSAVSFSTFTNGSIVVIFESYNTSDAGVLNFMVQLIDDQGQMLTDAPSQLFNSTSNYISDVIALENAWVATVIINNTASSTIETRLLVSGDLDLLPISNVSGFKTINEVYMTSYYSNSVLLVYRETFLTNSTVFWKSRTYNTTTNSFTAEITLVQDGEILGQVVASNNGLYVAIENTQSSQQTVVLGLVAYVASAFKVIPYTLLMLSSLALLLL